ncbi:protein TALPID3 isoform X2 [Cottoperca gobio]|uniref:Protein TALPID3-like isoform X2 n=1 Tax=Cottoperca gobio TaxID=56716 RepID=A0A6J2PGK7_COTGO|nr:protein TALPID3-like isoform X2 [Cottoperca gobio]XP_029284288.1 protein TALPID3-like isoform X2 [Cottoperca gobio]
MCRGNKDCVCVDDRCHRGANCVSTATQPAAVSYLRSSANHSPTVARTTNETLSEMGRLKTEMKMLLMPEDSLKTTRPGPDHHQYQQNLLHSQQHKSQIHETRQTESQQTHSQSHQGPFQQSQSQQIHLQSLQSQSQSHPNSLQQIQSQQSQTQSQLSQQSRSALVRRRPVVPSTLEEAGLVLRRVRRQKKVLEENLEALLRAKTGEVLHRQLEALATNRDCTEEVRVKKTVDAWINTLTRDIQFEMSSEDTAMTSQQRAAGRAVSALRGTGSQTAALRLSAAAGGGATGESYLTRLYGRAPYEGQRRTLKKSPYLRFSSPASPLSRKPRPRLLETVTGVKVKSSKTQTCLAPPLTPSPGRPHDIISPPLLSSGDPADLTVTSVPMAIPLGRPRMDSSSSRRLAEYQQEVTSPRTAPPTAVAVDDGASEPQVEQVEQLSEAPPAGDFMERQSEAEEDEDEEVFSGTDFLCVADVVQQQEEGSVVGEEEVQLDGAPPPPPVLYQGPVFPPQIRSALPAQDQASVLGLDLQRDALELRMVEWVEQQLMSRMILEMYLPPPLGPRPQLLNRPIRVRGAEHLRHRVYSRWCRGCSCLWIPACLWTQL